MQAYFGGTVKGRSAMNKKLPEAVKIFESLGWDEVNEENVLQLPMGDAVQRKTALEGLKSGEWGEVAQIDANTYGWRSYVDGKESRLALFAIRIGVDAKRAANIVHRDCKQLLLPVIGQRGKQYAVEFIKYICVSGRRGLEHTASAFGSVAVRLVDGLDLEIPQNVEYMKDWAVYAAAAMGFKTELFYKEMDLPELDMIQRRFAEHVKVGVMTNTPATGPFGKLLPEGVKRGWMSREQGLASAFSALDAAVRPGDRKVWLQVLDALEVTDEELCDRTQAFIPLLAMGDSALTARLAPVLISYAEKDLLCEILLASFSASTKKVRQLVLKTALNRPCPHKVEQLIPWLSMLAGDSDKRIAALAKELTRRWNITAEPFTAVKTGIQGLWQKTPPVWTAPLFRLGEISPEALTELAVKLAGRGEVNVHDVTTERFLAMVNAVAKQDARAARMSLQGLKKGDALIDFVMYWVKKETPVYGFDQEEKRIAEPLRARDYIICRHLGSLPCLLSMPSVIDLSITVPDLAARLLLYEQTGTAALEADLLLALTRLNLNTQTPESVAKLKKLSIPVVLQSGKRMTVTAGQAVLTYLEHPIQEPKLCLESGIWDRTGIETADSLPGFPNRFDDYISEIFSVFPLWGDFALRCVRWDCEVYHEKGLILRQVARRSAPLPPGASMNLLAAQRSATPVAAADSQRAVLEAWERGLLRPGVADIMWLDWHAGAPFHLAALAAAFDGIALDGMLSVIWPILDALIGASLKAPRLLAGTAELVALIHTYLPEVQFAVEKGLAENSSLALPQLRGLANREGTSRAVSEAKKVLALLPACAEPLQHKMTAEAMDPPFYEIWPRNREIFPPIEDGVTVSVQFVDQTASTKLFLFTLTLPDRSDCVFQVVKGFWYYDLEQEGQCDSFAVSPHANGAASDRENRTWLHWDAAEKRMVASEHRNWIAGTDGPLSDVMTPKLSLALITVLVGLLAQDGEAKYFVPRLLNSFIEKGEIGAEHVRYATRVLLKSPAVSPAKLVRVLEKDRKLLPVLWPMLTESVKAAGALAATGGAPPVWVNRILDLALRNAPYLAQAAKLGLIPKQDAQWEGISDIACAKTKSAAVTKAKQLAKQLCES